MAEAVHAYPCGCCGTRVVPGTDACPTCGMRLIDINQRHWAADAKDLARDSLDRTVERARATLRRAGPRKTGLAVAAGAAAASLAVGFALRRKRKG